jgi:hypothetical protein
MRERAWAKRSLEREQALKQAPRTSLRDALRRLLHR